MAYDQKVQDILSDYGTGDLSAAQARKALKSQGYKADFREVGGKGEIQVFPIDLGPDGEASGDYYDFSKGGVAKGKAVMKSRGGTFKGVF